MKRLTLEQAERTEIRKLGMGFVINKVNPSSANQVVCHRYWNTHKRSRFTWNHLERFVVSCAKKKMTLDRAYSCFLRRIKHFNKEDKEKLKKDWFELIQDSKNYHNLVYIDDQGYLKAITRKNKYSKPQKAYYKLNSGYWICRRFEKIIKNEFGQEILIKAKKGLLKWPDLNKIRYSDTFRRWVYDYYKEDMGLNPKTQCPYNWYWSKEYKEYLDKIFIRLPERPECLKTWKQRRKYYWELKRKSRRLSKLSDYDESKILECLKKSNESLKAFKLHQRELKKKQDEENIITRDRLGFDETSFKTPQKFYSK